MNKLTEQHDQSLKELKQFVLVEENQCSNYRYSQYELPVCVYESPEGLPRHLQDMQPNVDPYTGRITYSDFMPLMEKDNKKYALFYYKPE